MLHEIEKHGEHQVESSSTERESDPAPTIHIETSSLAISADGGEEISQRAETPSEAPQEATSVEVRAPIGVPETAVRPGHRWSKETAELPRWEKWKRRLPQACR